MHNFWGSAIFLAARVASVGLLCVGVCVLLNYEPKLYHLGFDIDSKNENENENENVEEKEDRISQLSDDVISSIISRLATVDAVRTSVLSRRWRHIYTHINRVKISCTDLCFPRLERTLQSQRKFVERVDTFLKHHSGSKIMSFELVCYFCGSISDKFKELMNSLGTLGVEQFTLGFCSNRYQSPVFSTDLLHGVKYLRLKGGSFLTPNKNALRVLELDRISFTSEAVQSLLSNCTSLQSMILRFCELPTKLLIHGPHLQLKSLTIFHCIYVVEIELSANNLTHFDICDLLGIVKLSFSHVPLLKTLALRFYGSEIVPYVFEKTAEDLPHLESMVFRTSASLFEGCKLDRVISKLINLGHLVLILEGHHHKLDLLELDVFLYSCPLLHKFQLSMEGKWTFNLKKALKRMVRRDNQLKEVEFNGLSEKNCEYSFIWYILKTILSLKRLVLSEHPLFYQIYDRKWTTSISNSRNCERRRQMIYKWLHKQSLSTDVEIIIL